MKTRLLILLLSCNYLSIAIAVNGVIEINQTCATQLGCFSGDSAGFPVRINGNAGSSYRLTSNLVVPSITQDGINITAPNIEIDLNGFAIMGIDCVGVTTSCKPPTRSFGDGITTADSSYHSISIKNGSILGMGRRGVYLSGENSKIENVTSKWNGADSLSIGLLVGDYGKINNCTVIGNIKGIEFSNGAIISNNIVSNNNTGITGLLQSMVNNNIIISNTNTGLSLGTTSAYKDNVIDGNGTAISGGIDAGGNICGTSICP